MRSRSLIAGLLVTSLAAALGCASEDPVRVGDDVDPEAMLEQRIDGTNDLALKLYQQLRATPANLLVSPHGIAVCCAMAYAGARGTTERQMAGALCFPRPQAGFHESMQALGDSLATRGAGLGDDAFQLRIVNGAWGADVWPYLPSYLRLLATYYGAGLSLVDFAGQPEAALVLINQWVSDQTEGRVRNLLPEGCIDAETYLVLANTVYFKASWLYQFQSRLTGDGEFLLLDGTTIQVPMMHGEQTFGYVEGEGYRAVELPYVGYEVSMIAVLPDSGRFAAFEADLDGERLDAIAAALTPTWITIWLPKFSYESAFDLAETLQALGMTGAFEPGADFTGMDGVDDGQPWIDEVAHKTLIAVDEYGTEAAAGTAMELTCGIYDSFQARRPFIFAIRDKATGTILFLGRVLDPR